MKQNCTLRNLIVYENLIYDKDGILIHWEKITYLLKGAETTGKPLEESGIRSLYSIQKQIPNGVKTNVKPLTTKPTVKCRRHSRLATQDEDLNQYRIL